MNHSPGALNDVSTQIRSGFLQAAAADNTGGGISGGMSAQQQSMRR